VLYLKTSSRFTEEYFDSSKYIKLWDELEEIDIEEYLYKFEASSDIFSALWDGVERYIYICSGGDIIGICASIFMFRMCISIEYEL
jgi:hypothetical protein